MAYNYLSRYPDKKLMETAIVVEKAITRTNLSHSIVKVINQYLIKLSENTTNFLPAYSTAIILTTVAIALLLLSYFVIRLLLIRELLKQKYTLSEVKPLQKTLQSSYTTQQLFTLIHGLAKQRSFLNRLFNVNKEYSFEIVATKDEGIRYLIRINQEDSELLQKGLLSYLPGLRMVVVPDYVSQVNKNASITEIKLANHFAFPLKKVQTLDEYDPIAYITGNMTKLEKNELFVFQIVTTPLNKGTVSDIKRISKLMYDNKDLVSNISDNGSNKIVRFFGHFAKN